MIGITEELRDFIVFLRKELDITELCESEEVLKELHNLDEQYDTDYIRRTKMIQLNEKEIAWFKVIFRHIRKQSVINSAFGDEASEYVSNTFWEINNKILVDK